MVGKTIAHHSITKPGARRGADGYACAFDPEEHNTIYLQWQQGRLHRYERQSEEALDIQPRPAPDDHPECWNWDVTSAMA